MTASFAVGNLVTQSLSEALEEIILALQAGLAATNEQAQRWRSDVRSVVGNLARIWAEADVAGQEALAEVYLSLSWSAEGSRLDAVAALLGLERRPARRGVAAGDSDGTGIGNAIPAGTRLRYDPTGAVWRTVGAWTVGDTITIETEGLGDDSEPELDAEDWTILDPVTGWDAAFSIAAQSVVGAPVETDPELRTRGAQEAYRRGQGPLPALEAAVAGVDGVSFVRAYDNPEDTTDANGVPARNVYVVVEGGTDAAVAAAIWAARGGGIRTHGTDIVETITTGPNRAVTIRADRVEAVPIYVRATLTTSTSEIDPPDNLEDQVEAALLAVGEATAAIGADVLPRRFAGALDDIEGFDAVTVELSLDGVAWSTAKRAMSASQRPTFAAGRISTVLA